MDRKTNRAGDAGIPGDGVWMDVYGLYRSENQEKQEAESGDPALLDCAELDFVPHATLAEGLHSGGRCQGNFPASRQVHMFRGHLG